MGTRLLYTAAIRGTLAVNPKRDPKRDPKREISGNPKREISGNPETVSPSGGTSSAPNTEPSVKKGSTRTL
eukprot:798263-Prorocentrum_minimum.AAC.2